MNYPKLVHGSMVATLSDELLRRVEYAKTSTFPRESLYEVYGRIVMAQELEAITTEEYLRLNTECVSDGLNNIMREVVYIMALNPRNLKPGKEQHEKFTVSMRRGRGTACRVQYDYRHTNGSLFSCVDVTLEDCQIRRDYWLRGIADSNGNPT